MILAKDRFGRIGRKVPGQGFEAKVVPSSMGERRGDLYLSARQIEEDQAYWDQKANEERAFRQAQAIANIARRKAKEQRAQSEARRIKAQQAAAKFDPMNELLKSHYAKKGMMGETETVALSVAPADFSSSGANPGVVPGEDMTGGQQWRADFRQQLIKGSPLTRDGVYGPAVTDYDRFVQGVDVNQTDIVAGGTMLGRHNGSIAPAGNGRQALSGMGFDWSWSGITSTVSNVASQTADNLVNALPSQLSQQLQQEILGTGGQVTQTGPGQITVQRPVTGSTTYVREASVVQPWMIYTGFGLLGLTVLVIALRR